MKNLEKKSESEDEEDNDEELFEFSTSEDCESDSNCIDSPLLLLLLSLVDSKSLLFIESVPDSNSSILLSILVPAAVLILSPLQPQSQ